MGFIDGKRFMSNLVDFGAGFLQMWGANDQARDLRSWWSSKVSGVTKEDLLAKIKDLTSKSSMDVTKKGELLQKMRDRLADIQTNQKSFSVDKAIDRSKYQKNADDASKEYAQALAKADLAAQAASLGSNALTTGNYAPTVEQIDDIAKAYEKEM